MVCLKDLKEQEPFELPVLVKSKALLTSKAGRPYLALRVMDRTAEYDCRVWDNVEEISHRFNVSEAVLIHGRMVRHQGSLQLHVSELSKLEQVSYEQLLPASSRDPEKMVAELLALVQDAVKDEWIRTLLLSIFKDPEIIERYKHAPAARSNHHAYLGGLLEHSLGLAKLGLSVLPHYPLIDPSTVIAGLLLHDIGKIYELSYKDGFNYTDSGKLIGHLLMGVELVTRKAALIKDFPEETLLLVKHTIVGHHGQIEYGSPVLPQTLEAIMVHFLDNMDSKLVAMTELLEKERGGAGNWTSYNAMYGRTMYRSAAFRNGTPPPPTTSKSPAPPKNEPSGRSKPLTVSLADRFQKRS